MSHRAAAAPWPGRDVGEAVGGATLSVLHERGVQPGSSPDKQLPCTFRMHLNARLPARMR